MEERAKEFQRTKAELEAKYRNEIDRKVEKIAKFQSDCQQLE
jgi:hypothetical protein